MRTCLRKPVSVFDARHAVIACLLGLCVAATPSGAAVILLDEPQTAPSFPIRLPDLTLNCFPISCFVTDPVLLDSRQLNLPIIDLSHHDNPLTIAVEQQDSDLTNLEDRPAVTPHVFNLDEPDSSVAHLQKLLIKLDDVDPTTREQARLSLMAVRRAKLTELQRAVRDLCPLAPSQKIALREIVMHIYLAGEYLSTEPAGFLGVRLPMYSRPEHHDFLRLPRGVMIIGRIEGFCAYRVLRDADVILAITSRNIKANVSSTEQLRDVIKAAEPGSIIQLEILRDSEILPLDIKLDSLPSRLLNADGDEFENDRHQRASDYFDEAFRDSQMPDTTRSDRNQ